MITLVVCLGRCAWLRLTCKKSWPLMRIYHLRTMYVALQDMDKSIKASHILGISSFSRQSTSRQWSHSWSRWLLWPFYKIPAVEPLGRLCTRSWTTMPLMCSSAAEPGWGELYYKYVPGKLQLPSPGRCSYCGLLSHRYDVQWPQRKWAACLPVTDDVRVITCVFTPPTLLWTGRQLIAVRRNPRDIHTQPVEPLVLPVSLDQLFENIFFSNCLV